MWTNGQTRVTYSRQRTHIETMAFFGLGSQQFRFLLLLPLLLPILGFWWNGVYAFVPFMKTGIRARSSRLVVKAGGANPDDDDGNNQNDGSSKMDPSRRNLLINTVAAGLLAASGVASYSLFQTTVYTPSDFKRLPQTQFIAALGDPMASQGQIGGASEDGGGGGGGDWGIWKIDPGPRGVWLRDYESSLKATGGKAPAGWTFDPSNWWLEEHGLIMEAPKFPLAPGRYLVTGGRMVTTGLTITGDGRWKLDQGTLYDVTHLPCRSARYRPLSAAASQNDDERKSGTPLAANPRDFPVTPGAKMPSVPGTSKQDYAVLFVVGKAT